MTVLTLHEMVGLTGFVLNSCERIQTTSHDYRLCFSPCSWLMTSSRLDVGFDVRKGDVGCGVVPPQMGRRVSEHRCGIWQRAYWGDGRTMRWHML